MTFLMNLIEELYIDDVKIQFFDGIDFDIVLNHPKDGSGGFIFCFIDNWISQVKNWERNSKINYLIENRKFNKFNSENIDNNHVAIYQLDGVEIDVLFSVIRDKVINKNFPEHPWIPISGINKGAWKIGKTGLSN